MHYSVYTMTRSYTFIRRAPCVLDRKPRSVTHLQPCISVQGTVYSARAREGYDLRKYYIVKRTREKKLIRREQYLL